MHICWPRHFELLGRVSTSGIGKAQSMRLGVLYFRYLQAPAYLPTWYIHAVKMSRSFTEMAFLITSYVRQRAVCTCQPPKVTL